MSKGIGSFCNGLDSFVGQRSKLFGGFIVALTEDGPNGMKQATIIAQGGCV